MAFNKEGDKSTGPCEVCQRLVTTTFHSAPLEYDGSVVPDVLQDFCDACGAPVSVPQQSAYKLHGLAKRAAKERVPQPSH